MPFLKWLLIKVCYRHRFEATNCVVLYILSKCFEITFPVHFIRFVKIVNLDSTNFVNNMLFASLFAINITVRKIRAL